MSYAIITVGGKQYRVQEGERLLVDRLATDQGKTFHPTTLLVGGDGNTDLDPKGVTVTAKVVEHVLGDKIRIGKYKKRTGYRRHTGFRARLTQIEIESIGGKGKAKPNAEKPSEKAEQPKAEAAEAPAGLPKGYEDMTVAQIGESASSWSESELEAALEYERANANRKTAVAALESAIEKSEEAE
jgi:large subunit ribosomal protein L21